MEKAVEKKGMARSLGIASPKGADVHEVYFEVESGPSVLGRLLLYLGQHKVDVLEAHAQVSDDKETGCVLLYVEMANALIDINQVLTDTRRMDFVRLAKAESKRLMFVETMMFPLHRGDGCRAFTLGSKSWSMLVESVIRTFGSAGTTILHAEGVAAGKGAAEAIKARLGATEKRVLIDVGRALFRADGLGTIEIQEVGKGYAVAVNDCFVPDLEVHAMEPLIVGLIRGYIEQVTNRNYRVEALGQGVGTVKFRLVRGMGDEFL